MNKKAINWFLDTGSSYTSEYQAVLDRATALGYTLPSTATKTAQNQLIVNLKSAGIWSLLDVFYVMMANDATLGNFSLLNWVSPSSYALTATNSPTYAEGGYTGNGSNSYLPSSFNPSTNGVNVTLNSASYFFWCNTNNTESKVMIGGSINIASQYRLMFQPKFDATNSVGRLNSTADDTINNTTASITTSIGLWHLSRTASTDYNIYQNGTLKVNVVKSSSVLPNSFEALAVKINGTPSLFSARQISLLGAGSGSINQSTLYTHWNTYKTAIGL